MDCLKCKGVKGTVYIFSPRTGAGVPRLPVGMQASYQRHLRTEPGNVEPRRLTASQLGSTKRVVAYSRQPSPRIKSVNSLVDCIALNFVKKPIILADDSEKPSEVLRGVRVFSDADSALRAFRAPQVG